jgi:CDP-diacylglycerol---glycerol-3-phosphate 3-phosphatidyltransferase
MTQHPTTLSDRVRTLTNGVMNAIGRTLAGLGLSANAITIGGLILVAVAAVFIGRGQWQVGGLILLVGLPMDALDGAVARATNEKSRFGEMLDSTLDRYADGLIFSALSYHFAVQGQNELMLLALAALLGSFMVSYTRARAEGIDVVVKIGLFSRLERVVVILIMLLQPDALGLPVLEVGLVLLAVGTNITGVQRLWFVYKALKTTER